MRFKIVDIGEHICCGKLEKSGTILNMQRFAYRKTESLYVLPTGVNFKKISFCPYCGKNISEIKVSELKFMDILQKNE